MCLKRGDEKMKGDEKPITIRGIVIPVDWDEKGKVVAVGISARDEQEYLVDKDHNGQELLHYIQEEVEVSGLVRETRNKKLIRVRKYILKSDGSGREFLKSKPNNLRIQI
jgi:hypothetical protein